MTLRLVTPAYQDAMSRWHDVVSAAAATGIDRLDVHRLIAAGHIRASIRYDLATMVRPSEIVAHYQAQRALARASA